VIVQLAVAVLLVALLTALVVGRRRREFQAAIRTWRATHPLGPDGIVPGAAPISLDAGDRAVVLLHGFGDTPQTLAKLAHVLHARGWTVRAPLLPGHGRTLESFHASRGEQWTATAREAFETLRAAHTTVAIVGLSMGGALAASLAAAVGDRAATLILLAPFLEVAPSGRLLTAAWPIWSLWRAWVPGDGAAAIHDPVARDESLGYGVSSPRALRELRGIVDAAGRASRQLHIPTLVMHSRTDYRIPVATAVRGFARIGATEKRLQWVERSGHVITVDRDADAVIATVADWLEQHAPPRRVASTDRPPRDDSAGEETR
jgi:carboxylesterase